MTEDRRGARCDRTRGLIDRIVAGRVTEDDRAHAPACDSCGPVLLRSTRFDDELRRTARALVAEQLPFGVLDSELAPPGRIGGTGPARHAAAGLASVLAAAVILAIATSVALAPGGSGPVASPQDTELQFSVPVLRSMADIVAGVQAIGYSCSPVDGPPSAGQSARPGGPRSVECLAPESLQTATVGIAPVETGDGKVVYVTIFGELRGAGTATSREALAAIMADLSSRSISDPQVARDASALVMDTLPGLRVPPDGDDALVVYGDVRVYLKRDSDNTYRLILQPT